MTTERPTYTLEQLLPSDFLEEGLGAHFFFPPALPWGSRSASWLLAATTRSTALSRELPPAPAVNMVSHTTQDSFALRLLCTSQRAEPMPWSTIPWSGAVEPPTCLSTKPVNHLMTSPCSAHARYPASQKQVAPNRCGNNPPPQHWGLTPFSHYSQALACTSRLKIG